MHTTSLISRIIRRTLLGLSVCTLVAISPAVSDAALTFTGVAAGDASSTTITLWTRAVDSAAPAATVLTLDITTDQTFSTGVVHLSGCTTDPNKDFTCKVDLSNLQPETEYFYRFVAGASQVSNVGRFKTSPAASMKAPLHFAFSGDNDGLMRPFALASQIPAQKLDFYVNLGDVIYETASNLTLTGPHNGQPWLNSAAVTVSGSSSSLNGVPASGPNFATQAQLKSDYEKKYRENFLPVNTPGQSSLQVLYASQGNYTLYDNHELGNRQYINGGAPAGGSVGGPTGTDMPTGRGVDARNLGAGNPGNINDVNTSSSDYMNRSLGFLALRDVFLSYQPISANRAVLHVNNDPRTDGSTQLFSAQQWGANAIYIHTDTRSYRDLRLKSPDGSADDTGARADNAGRTMFGATQLAWLKQTLLAAEASGTVWKFISVSDPIDQIGPIGGALALTNLPNFGPLGYAPVNADGGKSFIGGYRAERNDLLKFIADNHIENVVFIATDDHQNRINELMYSPTGQTSLQSSYVKVPYTFSIVAGPLGATGPDLITNHTFAMAKQYADSIVAAQQTAGVETLGLVGYPGLHNLFRDGDPLANVSAQAVDFYSPDTFNFAVLDVSADGRNLTVKIVGMDSTQQNVGLEYNAGPQARTILSFDVDAAPTVAAVEINDGSAQRSRVRSLTVTLNGVVPAASIGDGAFIVVDAEGDQFKTVVQSVSSVGRQTFITLGFTGQGVGTDGSLPDGVFTLSVNRNKIPVDTAAPITAIATFQTLFGDLDGNGRIDGSEVASSAHLNGTRRGAPDYLWYLDFNADGVIDGKDHREVARRNGGE